MVGEGVRGLAKEFKHAAGHGVGFFGDRCERKTPSAS